MEDEYVYTVRGKDVHVVLRRESLAGTRIPRVAVPKYDLCSLNLLKRKSSSPRASCAAAASKMP